MTTIHGKFLRPRAYSKPGTYIRPPENTVNDEGLSGYGGMMHLMNTNCDAMWLSERDITDLFIAFDFGSCVRLGFMCVWNFNQADGFGSGLKKVRIEYSLDGELWSVFSEVVLAQATGMDGMRATNLNDGMNSPIDFRGLSARYIRIVPDTETGDGCWGKYVEGQVRYGLSKVRFFLYRTDPEKGGEAYATGIDCSHNIITSNMGVADNKSCNDAKTMWISEPYPMVMDMVFDLNMTAFIRGFEYVNYNVPGFLDAGVKNVSVLTSINAICWKQIGDFTLERAKGSRADPFAKIEFPSPEYTRYVKFTVKGGAGDGTFGFCNGFEYRYGLGKLRFLYAGTGFFAEPARDFTAILSNYSGWNGADGLFSVGLDGKECKRSGVEAAGYNSMFLFSDSFLGEINPLSGARRRGDLVNNSFAYLKGLEPDTMTINFEYGKDGRKTHDNILKNENPFTYWMQDCAVIGNKFYVFTVNVVSENENTELPEGFRFRLVGVDMATFDIKDGKLDYSSQKTVQTPFFATKPRSLMFGCGVFVNTAEAGMPTPDGYAYVYGYTDIVPGARHLLCSRVRPEEFSTFDSYEFFDGKGWNKDIFASASISADVSPEMSVMPDDNGKYAYVYSPMGVGTTICLSIGNTPYGPFDNPSPLFDMARVEDIDFSKVRKVYCYNAKAHYHLAKENEMIISHNVNTMDYESHFINGNIYRPRFIRYRRY